MFFFCTGLFGLGKVMSSGPGKKNWCPSSGFPKSRIGLREMKVKLLNGQEILEVEKPPGNEGEAWRSVLGSPGPVAANA